MAEALAGVLWVALWIYTLSAGADFGGGVWDLFASGPRASRQREAIERAIAPIWEANHVWLILIVVVLFGAFPAAFSALAIGCHLPLVLMLIGIVLRGSAFVFRQYGGGGAAQERRWGLLFAIASAVTPIFLGMVLGAVTMGMHLDFDAPGGVSLLSTAWARPFPISVGLFALSIFAFLAATYLTVESTDPALQGDFRRRAMITSATTVLTGLLCAWLARVEAEAFFGRLLSLSLHSPLGVATALSALAAFAALARGHYRAARALAVGEVTLILLGWGAAQYPMLIAPHLTIRDAAAASPTLELLGVILLVGSVVLFPSLYWMIRVFKAR